MTQRARRPVVRPLRLLLAGLAISALVAGSWPAAAGAASPGDRAARASDAGAQAPDRATPSIQYEEAMAHAADPNTFVPGDRAGVGFRPRAGDAWPVGGHAPRSLPAGRLTGRDMAASTWHRSAAAGADASPATTPEPAPLATAPVDQPLVDPASLIPAETTSYVAPTLDAASDSGAKGLFRQVFGFLPYWEVSDSSTTLNYDLLSTIAYFSVGSDKNGNLLRTNSDGSTTTGWGGWTSSRMTNVLNAAHQKGTRVVLTITMFAWTSSQAANQGALLGNPTARLNLARQAAAAVRDRGADGINLDFEPIASGYADEFTAFVRTVRAELDRLAPGYQLTFDTTGYIGNYPIEDATAAGGADAIFIMGYDYRTAGSGTVGSIDPLAGSAYDLTETIAAYAARVPASKLILGIPYYGRAWSTDTDQLHAKNVSGTKFGSSTTVVYSTAIDYAGQYGRRYDSVEQAPWTAYKRENCTSTYGCVTSWRQLYYDDATSLGARYDLVNRTGLRGAGIWALGYDGTRPELYQALANKFQHDTTAPFAGIRALAPVQATERFAVAWVGSDDRGIASYDVQVSVDGGAWRDWLRGTTATGATYTGADGHGFAFRVRARDAAGNTSAWDVTETSNASPSLASGGFGRVSTDGLNVRTSPDTSATRVTTVDAGTIVAVTGGPVSADGYSWVRVDVPVTEWSPVAGVRTGVWVATGGSGSTFVTAAPPPNSTRVDLPAGVYRAVGARFVPLTPVRILDTRTGTGLSGAFASGTPRTFQVTGRGGVPSGAVAVTGNVTVTGSTAGGFVTLGPAVTANPSTSTLNAPAGDTRASGVTVALAAGGSLSAVFRATTSARAQLLFDVTGYFVPGTAGTTYVPLTPARVLDTRYGTGLSGAFSESRPRTFQVAGRGGVPTGATAITGNVLVIGPTSGGFLSVGPSATSTPTTSTLNLPRGDVRANGITVRLASNGTLSAVWRGASGSRANVVLDVTGYFVASGAGATYFPVAPVRLLDTRTGNGLSGAMPALSPRSFGTAGRGTVPADAVAVTGTLTVTGQTAGGFVTLGPTVTATPTTSTINAPRGDTRANGVAVRLGGLDLGAVFCAVSGSRADLLLDVTGYFR